MVSTPERHGNPQPDDANSMAVSPLNVLKGPWKLLDEKTQKKKPLHAGSRVQDGVTLAGFLPVRTPKTNPTWDFF